MRSGQDRRLGGSQAVWLALAMLALCVCCAGAVAQQTQDSQGAVAAAEQALSAHDFSRAAQILDPEVKLHPGDYRLWTLRGMAFAGMHDATSAIKAYRSALARRADYLPALEGAAQLEFDRNGSDAAALLQRVAALRPDDPTTHAMLGVLAWRNGNCDQAIHHFNAANAVIDSQLAALSEYGYCLARLERYDEAAKVLERATSLDAGSGSRYNLALVEWTAKRYDDALSTLASDVAAEAPEEDVLTLAAVIDESKNNTSQAVEMLRKAVSLHPRESEAYLAFARLSNDHASYQVGIDMLNAGISRMPDEGSLYLARGVLNAQKGDLDRAIQDFQTANTLDPRLSFAGTAEGIAQSQRHDPQKALAKLRAEARQHPDNAFNRYMIAETISQIGPRDGSALSIEELRAARAAVRLDPHLAIARNLLGGLLLQNGNYALSIQESRGVLVFDPDNQEALYHLILALKKANRPAEIPALTSRLVKVRESDRDAKSHLVRYELVEAATAGSGP